MSPPGGPVAPKCYGEPVLWYPGRGSLRELSRLRSGMMTPVTRSDVAKKLCEWRDGRLSRKDIHLWATELYARSTFEPADAVVNQVLTLLAVLEVDHLHRLDAPRLLEMLSGGNLPDERNVNAEDIGSDLASAVRVTSEADIAALPPSTEALFVCGLTDGKLAAIAARLPGLRHLLADGNTSVTDAGLNALERLRSLDSLDLEGSAVSDAGLRMLGSVRTLRWVDLGSCRGITAAGVAALRRQRPELSVESTAG